MSSASTTGAGSQSLMQTLCCWASSTSTSRPSYPLFCRCCETLTSGPSPTAAWKDCAVWAAGPLLRSHRLRLHHDGARPSAATALPPLPMATSQPRCAPTSAVGQEPNCLFCRRASRTSWHKTEEKKLIDIQRTPQKVSPQQTWRRGWLVLNEQLACALPCTLCPALPSGCLSLGCQRQAAGQASGNGHTRCWPDSMSTKSPSSLPETFSADPTPQTARMPVL
jgi:hypothetical protein